jgi:hypothetical protein
MAAPYAQQAPTPQGGLTIDSFSEALPFLIDHLKEEHRSKAQRAGDGSAPPDSIERGRALDLVDGLTAEVSRLQQSRELADAELVEVCLRASKSLRQAREQTLEHARLLAAERARALAAEQRALESAALAESLHSQLREADARAELAGRRLERATEWTARLRDALAPTVAGLDLRAESCDEK